MSSPSPSPPARNAAPSPNRVGRRLSYVLRHDPGSIDLVLDPSGWADVGELVACLARHGLRTDRAAVAAAVAADGKSRFTLSPDGARIRAAQGHSIEVSLGLGPAVPPDTLYHGTAAATLDDIFASGGLEPRSRRQVHLSADVETATRVGARHGRPTVLRIDAGAMHAEGIAFTRADNGVWLVDAVPVRFLSFEATHSGAA